MRRLITICAALGMVLVTGPANADVTLSFDSLPSAQGWTFMGDAPESSYSLVDGMLRQNTIIGQNGVPGAGYCISGPQVTEGYFKIDFRARVTDYQMYNYAADGHPECNNDFGFGVCIRGTSGSALIGISPTEIAFDNQTNGWHFQTALIADNTTFHDYRMEGMLAAGGSFSLYRDGVFLGSAPIRADAVNPRALLLGDMTAGASAIADITAYSYTNVPEPATLLLITLGGFVLRRRK
jgi:hypothetical protein